MNEPEARIKTDPVRMARCSSHELASALSFAAVHFEPFVPEINALNVFPVPDGDTGTNMFLTLQAAAQAANHATGTDAATIAGVLKAASRGALMGARGNSGVILYQVIEGLAQGAPDSAELDGAALLAGLQRATELAYQAVIDPVEGTMLTVIRVASESAESACETSRGVDVVLEAALRGAEGALAQTPELLPVLRQAGVVDAGGKGLVVILDGLRRFMQGLEPARRTGDQPLDIASSMAFLDQVDLVHDIDEFGYCTNFLLTGDRILVDKFRARMTELGSSAVVVGDERAIKVHVHSEHPGAILEAALEFGELDSVRIDNMAAQTRKLLTGRSLSARTTHEQAETLLIAVVAVASGDGLARALTGMGANVIVDGGPTNNPSTQEILAAVERAPSDTVIILPNDPNVIASARHVEQLTEKTVRIVPSKSLPQGISALSAFNLADELDENVDAMTKALTYVTTVALTRASRDAYIDGIRARKGEFIAILNGRIASAGDSMPNVALTAIDDLNFDEAELLTIFVGAPAEQKDVDQLAHMIEERYPEITVEIADGGQPHYDLILAVE